MSYVIPKLFMVFDCESVGLHGETYAVGWCLINRAGRLIAEWCDACDPAKAEGDDVGRDWLGANAPMPAMGYNARSPYDVRHEFWKAWRAAEEQGAVLVADCAWPVEARFLAACVDDHTLARGWEGPYPLHDLASIRLAAGLDPLGTEERLPDELPVHCPLADAKQSARLLVEALNRLCPAKEGGSEPIWDDTSTDYDRGE